MSTSHLSKPLSTPLDLDRHLHTCKHVTDPEHRQEYAFYAAMDQANRDLPARANPLLDMDIDELLDMLYEQVIKRRLDACAIQRAIPEMGEAFQRVVAEVVRDMAMRLPNTLGRELAEYFALQVLSEMAPRLRPTQERQLRQEVEKAIEKSAVA